MIEPIKPNTVILQLGEDEIKSEIKRKQDEFLDIYSLYQRTQLSWIKEALLQKAYELHLLDSKFTFHI